MPERTFPFATQDEYDQASNLNRPGVFRLNIGASKSTFNSLFGPLPPAPDDSGVIETGHDFTSLDEIMPHPVYGHRSWICVLNPGPATFEKMTLLLAKAYDPAVRKYNSKIN